jgi:hypothetical protein
MTTWGIFKTDVVSESYKKMKAEELKGNQHKLDKNKNGKIDSSDLKAIRNEEAEEVEEGWDDMMKSVKDKHGTQPNGGSGKKQGTRYGGGKQKDDEAKERKDKKNESVEVNEEYKVYSNSHNNPDHHTKHATLDSAKSELSKHKGGALYHGGKLYNKKTNTFESVEVNEEYKVYSNSHNNPDHHTKHSTLDSAKAELSKHSGGALYHKNKLYNKKTNTFESVQLEQFDDEAFYDGSDMLGEGKERNSSSYQFTHKPGDSESEKKLSDLKASVKGSNKRVVLQGRLGKNNPNAHKYSKSVQGTSASASSGAHTHQRIKKADAAHHDVYVYDKADTEYSYDEYIQEAIQQDVVKMGAKEIKHANMKDKQDDAEIMEPHSEGEANFIDKHYVNVTDDTDDKQDCGTCKLTKAAEPKGQGAGKYDGKNKTGVKEGTNKESSVEEACGKKGSGKKSFSSFKAKVTG